VKIELNNQLKLPIIMNFFEKISKNSTRPDIVAKNAIVEEIKECIEKASHQEQMCSYEIKWSGQWSNFDNSHIDWICQEFLRGGGFDIRFYRFY